MSALGIEAVLDRAMNDSVFAEQLFSHPDQALAGFELTSEEVAAFKSMARTGFDKYVESTPEERKSMAGYGGLTEPPSGSNHNQIILHMCK